LQHRHRWLHLQRWWPRVGWAVLLLLFGVPVVAGRFEKFDPDAAYALMTEMEVANAFIPPTALKMLRAVPRLRKRLGPKCQRRLVGE
jgi:acetyl-CoA synthetase